MRPASPAGRWGKASPYARARPFRSGTGPLGRRLHGREAQVVSGALGTHRISLVEPSLEQLQRDRVLELALDDPLERPRAVDRIVALRREQFLGLGRDLEPEVAR